MPAGLPGHVLLGHHRGRRPGGEPARRARAPPFFTRGALCGKVNHYLDALHGSDRLLHPMRRVGAKGEGRFERISWDEALELTADGIRGAIARHGPESVLPYYYAGSMEIMRYRGRRGRACSRPWALPGSG